MYPHLAQLSGIERLNCTEKNPARLVLAEFAATAVCVAPLFGLAGKHPQRPDGLDNAATGGSTSISEVIWMARRQQRGWRWFGRLGRTRGRRLSGCAFGF